MLYFFISGSAAQHELWLPRPRGFLITHPTVGDYAVPSYLINKMNNIAVYGTYGVCDVNVVSFPSKVRNTHPKDMQTISYTTLLREGKTAPVTATKAWNRGGVTPLTYHHLQNEKVSSPFLYTMQY
jgi:hypothetical protein